MIDPSLKSKFPLWTHSFHRSATCPLVTFCLYENFRPSAALKWGGRHKCQLEGVGAEGDLSRFFPPFLDPDISKSSAASAPAASSAWLAVWIEQDTCRVHWSVLSIYHYLCDLAGVTGDKKLLNGPNRNLRTPPRFATKAMGAGKCRHLTGNYSTILTPKF